MHVDGLMRQYASDVHVAVLRELLGEVSLFPLQRILELARLLVVPGAIPVKAGPDAVHSPQRQWKTVNFYLPGTSGI